jgi:hypothetical protein
LPREVLAFARMTMHFPVVGVITDHLIDGSWYGDNTDQREIDNDYLPEILRRKEMN